MMRLGLALLGMVLLLAQAQSFKVEREMKFEVALKAAGPKAQVTLAAGSANLRVQVGSKIQALAVGTVAENLEPRGQILAQDFNFDGWLDLAVPMGVGYGGVNYFYDLYTYNAQAAEFELRKAPSSEGPQFCNPQLRPAERILTTTCKSGPAYFYADFKFDQGRPYLYRTSETLMLEGFPKDEQLVYRVQLYDAKGQPQASMITSDTRDGKPIVRSIPHAKVFLHSAPHLRTRTEMYLVKGDKVEVLEVTAEYPQWLKVAYQSAKLGRIVKWIKLEQ
jgi:hypothetical protein